MYLTRKFNIGFALILFCILLPACGPSPEELAATSAAETAAAATNTPIPPTVTPTPTPTLQPFVVTLDGNECTLSGPTEVPPGEYPFFINNKSELDIPFQFVRNFLDEKTYQDVLDLQSEPGEFFSMPSWTLEVPYYYSAADDVNIYILDTIGEHFFYTDYHWKGISFLWLCPPFLVVDAPSK